MWGAFNVHGVDERNSVESVRTKIVQVNWVGAGVKPMKRMKALQGNSKVGNVISGTVALTQEATEVADIDAREVATKLLNAGGAHKPSFYDFGGDLRLTLADLGREIPADSF